MNYYNIWVKPYMPSKEETEPGIMYLPQTHLEDKRFNFLDKQVYLNLCIKEQLDTKRYKNIDEIVKDIKTHPDRDEEILNKYLEKTNKTIDEMTNSEWNNLSKFRLTYEDVENSLNRLNKLGI